jgi:hypothetical protein
VLERLVVDRAALRERAARDRARGYDYLSSSRSADVTATYLRARVDALVAARS